MNWSHRRRGRRRLLLLLILSTSQPAHGVFADFAYPSFSGSNGLVLIEDAVVSGNALRLTAADLYRRGAVWHPLRQAVQWGFETSFQFRITEHRLFGGGDGLVFVVQNHGPSAISEQWVYGGSDLGYQGIPNSVAVEFDTFALGGIEGLHDPDGDHISVHTRGTLPNDVREIHSIGSTDVPFPTSLSDGMIHTAHIRYAPGNLEISLDGATAPLLTASLDLAAILTLSDGRAYVGFTSATGGHADKHEVLSWSFQSVPEPTGPMIAGIACVIVGAFRPASNGRHRAAPL